MSFTETLFGGLAVIVTLYFLNRRFGISNYWSSFVAGALPLLIYLLYSMTHGVAGDVLAMHLAVFVATAGVLGVFGGLRGKGQKLHWAPKLLLTFFIFLVLLMAMFLSIAINGIPSWVVELVKPTGHHQVVHTEFSGATNNAQSPD